MSAAADEVLSAEVSLALGDSYYIDEDYEQALDAYAIALLSSSSSNDNTTTTFRLHSHKAAALLQLERYAEAVEESQLALNGFGVREGETEACQYRLGLAWMKLENAQEALSAIQQAMQLASLNQRPVMKYQECVDKIMAMMDATKEAATPVKGDTPTTAVEEEEDDDKLVVEEVQQKAPPLPSPTTATTRPLAKKPTMPKYQYYQSDTVMTIAILEPNVLQEHVRVDFRPKKLTVVLTKQGVDFTVICGRLFDTINVEKSKVVCKESKVLVKLRKRDAHDWNELFSKAAAIGGDDDDDDDKKPAAAAASKPTESQEVPTVQDANRPYASTRDWNAIERNLKQEEAQEKPEGEDAMNALFHQIYSKADDATKRAMIKSYQTSGGTVLSTNWDEVKDKDYEHEREAPKGMEWKTWEGQKVKPEGKSSSS